MRTLKVVLALCLIAFLFTASAQQQKMTQIMEDVFQEQENNLFTIRFFNVLTGDPVPDAFVMVENIGSFSSDSAGRVMFSHQPDGLLKAVFKKVGYISTLIDIDIAAKTILRNRYFVSPVMDIEQFRVVLSWDQQPEDLDAHFVKTNSYHISYRNTRILNDGTGQLDRDDMDGYGPETITVTQLNANREYTYFVYNYSAKIKSSACSLANSKATVWIYGNNKLLHTIHIPTTTIGDTWTVFKVVQGIVIPF